MKRKSDAPAVTSLPRAPQDEADGRVRQYLITMGIRVACFILMVAVQPYGWYTWVFGLGAAILPYFAVVVANAGDDSVASRVESPLQEITAPAPQAPAAVDETPSVITISESPRATEDSDAAEPGDGTTP